MERRPSLKASMPLATRESERTFLPVFLTKRPRANLIAIPAIRIMIVAML